MEWTPWGFARNLLWRSQSWLWTGTEHDYGWSWCSWFC